MAKYVGFKQGKVHENHVISEYYCGGCGYPVTDHDSFCSECGGAFHKCDADDDQISRLEAENDKRDELIRDMMRFFEDDDACEHCGHDIECVEQNGLTVAYAEDCLMRDVFKERMHKLGIEKHL